MDLTIKSKAELAALRDNAERVLADPKRSARHAEAQRLLDSLPVPPPPAGRGGGGATPQSVAVLKDFAARVAAEYDLSPPAGTKHPHQLVAKDGTPKVGGRQRKREVAADRYISHRRGDAVATLGWLRRLEEDSETGGAWYLGDTGAPAQDDTASDFAAASAAFLKQLDAMGTPRR
ncbi:hypothetical protein [Falsiroseomonas sp.]|uniref:hypothetical protein n=1 Tax=Falsiroseomonas sp. TaxID=2870721 RepID=UPI00271F693E|nr:hypothetical protein [Falsiroseomonas sp.]MDO9503244.1 hypothetical protein [Falsiroseomonas sp.]